MRALEVGFLRVLLVSSLAVASAAPARAVDICGPGDIDSLNKVSDYACACYRLLGLDDAAINANFDSDFDCTDGTELKTKWTVPSTTPLKPGCAVDGANQVCELNASQDGLADYADWPDGSSRSARWCKGGAFDGSICTSSADCKKSGVCDAETHLCTGGAKPGAPCLLPADCPGAICEKRCMGDKDYDTCTADANCGKGKCRGRCKGGAVEGAACDADSDCPEYQGKCLGLCDGGPQAGELCSTDAHCKDDTGAGGNCTDATGFPPRCDNPAWLSNACYGHTFIQSLPTGKKDVSALLLCRHKNIWSDDNNTFDDVAMVMHDKSSGNTCWFQAEGSDLNGTKVLPPNKDTTNAFWFKPKSTGNVRCNGCHDNGAWMNSPWMRSVLVVPEDKFKKYKSPGKAFEGELWKDNLAAGVTVAKNRLGDKAGPACTSCHRISKVLYGGTIESRWTSTAGGQNQGTWGRWMDYVTGGGPPDYHQGWKFASRTSPIGRTWAKASWMPDEVYPADPPFNENDFKSGYGKYLADLSECAKYKLGPGCEEKAMAALVPTAAPSRATMITRLGSGPVATSDTTLGDPRVALELTTVIGDTLQFEWSTDGVTACSTEATLPETVYRLNGIKTGSNWPTASGIVDLGRTPNSGDYVFEIACDGVETMSYPDPPKLIATVVVHVVSAGGCPP